MLGPDQLLAESEACPSQVPAGFGQVMAGSVDLIKKCSNSKNGLLFSKNGDHCPKIK
jgi:hypothetical protein